MSIRNILLALILLLLFSSCYEKITPQNQLVQTELQAFNQWKQDRITNLKKPFGWLSLTGLYWLKSDSLSIGTSSGFDINLAHHTSVNMGTVSNQNDRWYFSPTNENLIKLDDSYVNTKVEMQHDQSGSPSILNYESLFWYVIKREDNYGIRLKDTLNPARLSLSHIPIFDFDPVYQKKAKVIWASNQDSILITNAQGVVSSNPLKGWLEFQHEGKTHTLAGTNGGPNTWFIVFGDETNSGETYGAGRFLYVPVSENASSTILDFNRAQNPPCYFTEFATCPLPPKQNKLKVEILAGERSEH